jgi:hypothetical protein
MIVALMQPYFFPYIGYFSLMAAADVFIAYDNVQYTRPGWINRNRILRNGAPDWWTAVVADAPHTSDINQRQYRDWPAQRRKLIDLLAQRYRRAPHRASGMALVEQALPTDEDNVARCNTRLLSVLAGAFSLRCRVMFASDVPHATALRGVERVLSVCDAVGATTYVNSPGGLSLYRADDFSVRGVALRFVKPEPDTYVQGDQPFVPWLSIVDALMFLPIDDVARRVRQYRLVEACS